MDRSSHRGTAMSRLPQTPPFTCVACPMIPQQGEWFRLPGARQRYRCIEVRQDCVLAYGGSTDPGGRQGFRTFELDAPFVIVRLKEKSDA